MFQKPNRPVTKVFLHCSASDNAKHDNVATIKEWHLARGFNDIGYHFYVDKFGRIFPGRDIEKVPAAQKGHNTGSIAICAGGLKEFTQVQLAAVKQLCTEIDKAYQGAVTFHGHHEVEPLKTCPVYDYKKLLNLSGAGHIQY